ncbi:MAG: AAA family ATPase [Gammaproteobacteria bacterium]|nr:AAA family ATPase [Gammaproteobacteria bacterium]
MLCSFHPACASPMYHSYFGLQEEPFSIAVNPKYLFMSARHRDALAHLLYGVGGGGGFILLTGEVGTGKTTLNRCLLEQLPEQTDIAIILNPALNAEELLASVCDELGIDCDQADYSLKTLTDRLHDFLLANHRRGRNTVLLIDEAQHLQFEVLEQIRLLTNLETNTRKLLQIVLVGQPELSAMLAKPELRQLNQRITARYELQPLNLGETDAYIRHRLQVAGLPANQEIFPARIVRGVYRKTRGIPRLINVLCGRMLLGTYGQNKALVDMAMLRQATAEVMGESRDSILERMRRPLLTLASLVLVAVLVWWYGVVPGQPPPGPGAVTPQPAVSRMATPRPVDPQLVGGGSSVQDPALAGSAPVPVNPWYSRRGEGLAALAAFLGVAELAGDATCAQFKELGWRCEKQQARTWDEVLNFDRPALLALVTEERFAAYAALVGVSAGQAFLLFEGQEVVRPLAELGRFWQGEFVFLWRPPREYSGPVSRGDAGPMVAWLAQEFARLDGQLRPLTQDSFTAELDTRVRLFQRQFNLRDDGVVGMKTLLKLGEVRGTARGLARSAASLANVGMQ